MTSGQIHPTLTNDELINCLNGLNNIERDRYERAKHTEYGHLMTPSYIDINDLTKIMQDNVETPTSTNSQIGGDHYTSKAIQPIDYIHANGMGFCEGNVVKYVTRHKDKNGKQDIEKAIHYLQLILQQQYS